MSLGSGTTGWLTWLTTDTPRSRLQARAVALWQGWGELRANTLAMIGLGLIVALLLMAAFAPLIATHHPDIQNLNTRLLPPGAGHWLGTDELGRDVWSRLVFGSRVTLYVVALVAVTAPVLGLVIGTVAGTLGGWTDRVLM
uniref:ABC transporter permease n=1 Tax=Aureimonas sp. AU12 TaxID=1638161 RepID=UPI000A99107B